MPSKNKTELEQENQTLQEELMRMQQAFDELKQQSKRDTQRLRGKHWGRVSHAC